MSSATEKTPELAAVAAVVATLASAVVLGYVLGDVVAIDDEAPMFTAALMPIAMGIAWGATQPLMLIAAAASLVKRLFRRRAQSLSETTVLRSLGAVFVLVYAIAAAIVGTVGGAYRDGFSVLGAAALFAVAALVHGLATRRVIRHVT